MKRLEFVAVVCLLLQVQASAGSFGRFEGTLDVRLGNNGREATLLAPFSYVDPAGKVWRVPKGVTVNGASIPQVFWSILGGPWDGKYREASVIHDYFCDVRTAPWKDVHMSFYTAMRANGVPEPKARVMYAAVYRFGPRWDFLYTPKCPNCLAAPHHVDLFRPAPDRSEVEAWTKKIEQTNPSLDDIEREADLAFNQQLERLELGSPVLVR